MYTWLFFKVYDYFRSINNHNPALHSSLLVFFAQIVHVAVLLFGLAKIFDFSIPLISADKTTNKLIFMPFLYLWSVFVTKFYKNKIKKNHINYDVNPINLYQLLLIVFVIIFIPLYIGIRLSGGQIWRFD